MTNLVSTFAARDWITRPWMIREYTPDTTSSLADELMPKATKDPFDFRSELVELDLDGSDDFFITARPNLHNFRLASSFDPEAV